ncbi:hypothetical protein CO726_29215 [Bacillus fungorum]|uniref:Uncharacterized protein n=1 Tax=Bacillus fungorum TaxID=2039284 RepID=A0A2G6Q557_9BACI|nr:hypothetical protein [Bacillus fungorum]PIE91953.1 hypothetical protein CO726_29215 [Bacillus fungorum]
MNFREQKMKFACATLALSVGFGLTAPSFSVSAAEVNNDYSSHIQNEKGAFSKEQVEQLKPVLKAIEDIPDQLLVEGNEDAINEYFKDKDIALKVSNDVQSSVDKQIPIMGVSAWDCSLAIGELLVMNAIPIAKLAKIKKYVKALGGAWETAKLLVGATTAGEKVAALSALIAELTGFTNVKKECGL